MRILIAKLALVGLTCLLGLTACGKSGSKADAKSFKLTGASEVIAALEKKDYEAMMGELAKVKASVTPEQMDEYGRLRSRVSGDLVDAMGTNEAAAKAYKVLRFMETGR